MSARVTLYSRPGCGPCRATERALNKAGVHFEHLEAADHRDALIALGHTQAPVVTVQQDGGRLESWQGFRPDLLAELAA